MEEKYYIPDISEFKAGFEFEILGINNRWMKGSDSEIPTYYLPNQAKSFRVKYLDSEDIISLGFNFSHDVYVKNCGDRLLSLVIKDDKIRICEMSNSDKYKVLFYGKIKNKSELKDILEKI